MLIYPRRKKKEKEKKKDIVKKRQVSCLWPMFYFTDRKNDENGE